MPPAGDGRPKGLGALGSTGRDTRTENSHQSAGEAVERVRRRGCVVSWVSRTPVR